MVYTNLDAVKQNLHGIVELSNLKSTITGKIYDAIVRDASDKEIDVDNGVLVKMGAYTGEGLQTRYATVAGIKDKVALTSTPALIKDAFTKAQEQEYNFYNKAGAVSRAHSLVPEDIFGIASYQITSGDVAVGSYIVVDGNGGYEVVSADPSATNGFVGRIHSINTGVYYTIVRIEVLQNEQLA